MTPLPPSWVTAHLMQLAVALIPWSVRDFMGGLKDAVVSSVLRDFHKSLAERLAEVLRRREELVATVSSSGCGTSSLVSTTTTATITTTVVAIGSSSRRLRWQS